jgi:hypothetical protein
MEKNATSAAILTAISISIKVETARQDMAVITSSFDPNRVEEWWTRSVARWALHLNRTSFTADLVHPNQEPT